MQDARCKPTSIINHQSKPREHATKDREFRNAGWRAPQRYPYGPSRSAGRPVSTDGDPSGRRAFNEFATHNSQRGSKKKVSSILGHLLHCTHLPSLCSVATDLFSLAMKE
jgi:hypothetical protein